MPPSLESTARAEPPTAARWVAREVGLILVAQMVFGFGWSLYLLVPKFMATALHAGPELIGHVNAIGGIAGLLTVPFAARGLDRFGRTHFFRAGAALIVLLSLGFMYVRTTGVALYVLQGCVAASFVLAFNAAAALLADWAPPERLGQAIGWLGGANVLMNAVATAVAEPLAARHGWQVVFELGVVAGSLAFALSFALRPASAPPAPATPAAAGPRGRDRSGELPGILVATVLVGAVFVAVFTFVQPYALSLGAREVRGFFLGFTISAVVGRVLLGGLGDRFGRRTVSIWMAIGYALAALLTVDLEPGRLVLYGLAFGAAHGLLYPTLNALVLEVVSADRRGFGMTMCTAAFNVGTSTSSFGWGWLAAHHGYRSVYTTATGFALLAAFVLWLGRARGPRVADS
jgi:MFS family permease